MSARLFCAKRFQGYRTVSLRNYIRELIYCFRRIMFIVIFIIISVVVVIHTFIVRCKYGGLLLPG